MPFPWLASPITKMPRRLQSNRLMARLFFLDEFLLQLYHQLFLTTMNAPSIKTTPTNKSIIHGICAPSRLSITTGRRRKDRPELSVFLRPFWKSRRAFHTLAISHGNLWRSGRGVAPSHLKRIRCSRRLAGIQRNRRAKSPCLL